MLLNLTACKVKYSFTGGTVHPEAKTISIAYFQNRASFVQPTLSQKLTDALRDKFLAQTRLQLVNTGGDYQIEGKITDYNTRPVAIQGNETAALNRLTVTISVKFVNRFDEKQNFETSFSRYEDYPSSQSLASVEEELIKAINQALVEDIFNRIVINW